ncbi:srg family chemoreceptor domain-containing protein [Ditylenchus destructor]|nr:srg family chemoreceptor domain-containing protein [Ditylenchus destructor]
MDRNESSNVADAIFAFLAGYLYYPQLSGVIPLFYAIPTFALNIFVNYIMLRHLKTPFYRLYIFSNVAQCITWFSNYYMFRASITPFFYPIYALIPPSGWIPTLLNFIPYYALYVYYFLEFILTFNRFTVVAFPLLYTRLWKKIMSYVMIFALLYPILLTWHLIRTGATSVLSPSGYLIDADERLTGTYLFFNLRSKSDAQIYNVIQIQLYIEDVHVCLTPCFILLLSSALRDKIRSTFFKGTKFDKVFFRSVANNSQL